MPGQKQVKRNYGVENGTDGTDLLPARLFSTPFVHFAADGGSIMGSLESWESPPS